MRYNVVAYLGVQTYTMDAYHNQTRTITWRKVYANHYYGNIQLQQQAAINDGRQMEQYSIRASEYDGEKLFKVGSDIWTVTLASGKGDNVVLTVESEVGNNGTS